MTAAAIEPDNSKTPKKTKQAEPKIRGPEYDWGGFDIEYALVIADPTRRTTTGTAKRPVSIPAHMIAWAKTHMPHPQDPNRRPTSQGVRAHMHLLGYRKAQ